MIIKNTKKFFTKIKVVELRQYLLETNGAGKRERRGEEG